jgi:glutamyl-tRNA synthetase
LLHLGHARTFGIAHQRARAAEGTLILRIEDIDPERCKQDYTSAIYEDLQWLGIDYDEGHLKGGPCKPYLQSRRIESYQRAWQYLRNEGHLYACSHSRKTINEHTQEHPHGEALFPKELRPAENTHSTLEIPGGMNWRFRVPDGKIVRWVDQKHGPIAFTAGIDFGDFLVWRRIDAPSYELAVVVDDLAMQISEVVRGDDLLLSTARQILLYEALGNPAPAFYHAPLVRCPEGERLAKRTDALSIRALREYGFSPQEVLHAEPLELQLRLRQAGK